MANALRAAYSTYPGNAQTSVVVVAGDLIIVGYSYNQGTDQSPTISDNAGGGSNTYSTRMAGTAIIIAGADAFANAWYAVAKASETLTITCTVIQDNGLSVHVVSGADQTLATVQDGSIVTGLTGATTGHTTSNITTTASGDYLFCYWYQEQTADTLVENGGGFTFQTNQGSHDHWSTDQIAGAAGTYADITTSGLAREYAYFLLAFKAAAAGGVTTEYVGPIYEQGFGKMVGRRYV